MSTHELPPFRREHVAIGRCDERFRGATAAESPGAWPPYVHLSGMRPGGVSHPDRAGTGMSALRGKRARGNRARDEEGEERLDGRALRSVRSRERILDALTELIGEGNLQPTGERVAARAGYGLRTVYRHFDDMEGLYRELQTRLESTLRPPNPEPLLEGSVGDRIADAVARRVALFERASPFLRSGASLRWRSTFLAESQAKMVRDLRQDLLRCLPEAARASAHRREAIELMTSFEAWDRLRTDQKLGRDRAQRVVEQTLRDLLGVGDGARRGSGRGR